MTFILNLIAIVVFFFLVAIMASENGPGGAFLMGSFILSIYVLIIKTFYE